MSFVEASEDNKKAIQIQLYLHVAGDAVIMVMSRFLPLVILVYYNYKIIRSVMYLHIYS